MPGGVGGAASNTGRPYPDWGNAAIIVLAKGATSNLPRDVHWHVAHLRQIKKPLRVTEPVGMCTPANARYRAGGAHGRRTVTPPSLASQ